MNIENNVDDTWINEIFQGTFSTITRCLTCETVSFFLGIMINNFKIKIFNY